MHSEILLSTGEAVAKFVVDFEKRYRDVEKHEMKLPTGAKAYFLQQSANLTIDNERLAQATSKLEYDDMKAQIQKVFGETVGSGEDKLPIKTEECNYIKGHSIRGRGRGASLNSRNWRGRGQGGFMNRRRSSFSEANPVGIDGTVMRCHNCKSVKRFASSCPHQQHRTEEAFSGATFHIPLTKSATLNKLLHCSLWQFSGALFCITGAKSPGAPV